MRHRVCHAVDLAIVDAGPGRLGSGPGAHGRRRAARRAAAVRAPVRPRRRVDRVRGFEHGADTSCPSPSPTSSALRLQRPLRCLEPSLEPSTDVAGTLSWLRNNRAVAWNSGACRHEATSSGSRDEDTASRTTASRGGLSPDDPAKADRSVAALASSPAMLPAASVGEGAWPRVAMAKPAAGQGCTPVSRDARSGGVRELQAWIGTGSRGSCRA
jgi:hypothetical protein